MKHRRTSRFLAIVLLVAMTLSLMPTTVAFAEDSTTTAWTQTTLDQITAEDTVAITMTASSGTTYVLPTAAATNAGPKAEAVTPDGTTLTLGSADAYGWTIVPGGDGTYTITGPNGGLYVTNNNNGVRISGTSATWSFEQDHFKASDGTQDRYLGATTAGANGPDWRCYKSVNNNIAGTTNVWKLNAGGETPDPTETPEPTEAPEPTINTIGEALAASSGTFTVKGVVTLMDGKNVYIQDETGGICLYLSAAPTDLALGDTVIGTGTRATYLGLPELSGASYEKSEGLTLSAKETTIDQLTTADICTYVKLSKLTVTAVDDNNGAYSNPNINLKDENGNEIQLYKAVIEKDAEGAWTVAVDDVIDVIAAVGVYNTTLQLRNNKAEEITKWVDPGQDEPEDSLPKDSTVVLFTNDVHCGIEDGWGYAGLADLRNTLEANGNTVILVDAGDHVQGGPIGTLSEGAYIIDIMNFVGYDLAVPGNHEFDYTMSRFFANVEKANFPYVSANFMNYVDGVPTTPVLDAYKIFESNGKKIAFVGVCTPETLTKSTPTYFQDEDGNFIYGFGQDATGLGVYTATQNAVDAARAEGADYVVIVGHCGIDEQSSPWTAPEIIANITGVDAMIDGHSHSVINTTLNDKDGKAVLHGQTGTKLANIGMLVFGEEGLKIELLPASEKVQDDAATAEYIADVKAQYESLLKEVVAYTPFDLTVNDPDTGNRAVRSAETNLGDLCADAYLNMLDADIAFVNGGGVRKNIAAGEITFEDILNVHPFGNAACLVEVTGQQILDALELGSRVCPGENGGFLQVAGLTYEIHTSLEPNVTIDDSKMWTGTAGVPYRVQNVQVLNKTTGEYEPLDLTKTYKLASHNYMLKNQGDGFAMFGTKNITILKDEVMLDNKVLINYIQSMPGKTVGETEYAHVVADAYSDPRGQGRIVIVPEEPEVPVDTGLVVLFTNDVHCGIEDGWGYAGLADLKKSLEAEGNTVLLIDAGDHVQGGAIGTLSEGAYIIDIMNFVGYDMAVPGNHEFDYTMTKFFENVEHAKFPYVSANFMHYVNGEPTTPILDAYKIFEADGKKVAFVGLCTPETITKSTPTYFQDEDGNYIYGFCQDNTGEGVVTAAQAAVDAAKAEGADYVILVGHLGIDEQSSPWTAPEIISQMSGVDAVIDGHSHSTIDAQLLDKDGKTVLHGQTGTKLANIGKLSFLEDGSLKIELLPASEKVQDDAETAEYIAGIKAQYESLLQEVVAYTDFNLTTKDPDTGNRAVRSAETNLGDLCADAYLNMLDADVAFVNGGGVRADIPAGEITYGQILNVHPFGNAACLVEVTGQQILDALEMGSRVCPGENGGFLQVAGLTYEIHTSLEPNVTIDDSKMWTGTAGVPYRVQNVHVLNKTTGEYEPLDLAKTYKLASHNYMLKNQGDGFAMFGTKNVTVLLDEVMLDNKVLINYIQSLPGDADHEHVVSASYSDPRGQGRIVIVPEEPEVPETVTLQKLTEAPADGDKVVIFYPANNLVLTATANGKKLAGTAATPVEDKFDLTEEMAYLAVSVTDGTYTFANAEGKFLTSAETGNGLSFAEDGSSDLAKWTLEQQADGTWYLMNVGAVYNGNHNQALEYYSGFTTFGVKADNPAYKFEFYGEPKPAPKTGLVTDLADLTDGSYVVIYNQGHSIALTSDTYQDWYLLGAAATITDGEIAEPDAKQVWKVTVNEDGSYTFTQDDYTIAAWLSGTYVELTNNGSYNDATATGWNLEVCNAENSTFYVSSSTLSTSYGKAYIEAYYKKQVSGDTFCGYSTGTAKLTENDYGMQFYLVPAPEKPDQPDDPTPGETNLVTDLAQLTDGSYVVIYNKANKLAMTSNTYRDWYLLGAEPTFDASGNLTDPAYNQVWKVNIDSDGNYTFTQDDKNVSAWLDGNYVEITSNASYNESTSKIWALDPANAENHTFYMRSADLTTSYGGAYIEVYGKKVDNVAGTLVFCGYSTSADKLTEAAYGMQFYLVDEPEAPEEGDLITKLSDLTDGATVAIYSPGHKTAISTKPNGDWYLKANSATVANGKVQNFTADFVWKVKVNDDGTYSFYANDDETKSITVWASGTYAELSLNVANYPDNTWTLTPAKTDNCFYISSPTVSGERGAAYIEAYVRNESEVFSGYFTSTTSYNFTDSNFALQFYLVNPEDAIAAYDDGEWDGVMNKGEQYLFYNATAASAVGLWKEANYAFDAIPTTIVDGKAVPGNGAYVFTVDTMGRYYSFELANGKYLATNEAEELLFVEKNEDGSVPENAKWFLTKKDGGYIIYNKDATYNGTPVCIEYYSSVFSGWTFSTKNDVGIYLFNFYKVADGTEVREGVVQAPSVIFDCEDTRYFEQDYEVSFSLDDLAEKVESIAISYTANGETTQVTEYTVSADGKIYSFTVPADKLDGERTDKSFTLTVDVFNSYEIRYQGVKTVTNVDEPFFEDLTPAPNTQTREEKRPTISAKIKNQGEDAEMTMTVNGEEVKAVFEEGLLSFKPAADLQDGRVTVKITVTRKDGVSAEKTWSFTVGIADFQLYFGQLHSHTTYSDGSGTLETALDYIGSLPESANVQFVAFTDHSNYFDTTSAANPADAVNDKSLMTDASRALWQTYKDTVAAFNEAQSDIIAIAGFEMTWSGGPGHINTFDSDGLVSRNNAALNNKTGDAGMKLYYDSINKGESLNQFNHPGTTFGNFTDFAYWDEATDAHMFLVEVGNGEGQIGAGGYYPSYEQYILALDKGWHVAPTNNQDNHKGRWGNANDARDVVLTNDFSEQGIYDAIRALRVYATEDKNLQVYYTVNDMPMGTIFSDEATPEKLALNVTVYDPDAVDSIAKVEVVVNGGTVAYTWTDAEELAEGALSVELAPEYSYYFIRVTQKDGDLAVTAPVWVGKRTEIGITDIKAAADEVYKDETTTLTTTLFNNEESAATVKSLVYTVSGNVVIGTDTTGYTIPAGGTLPVNFEHVFDEAKLTTVTVTATVEFDGKELTYSANVELDILDRETEGQVTPIAQVRTVTMEKGNGYRFTIEGVVTSNASDYDKDTAFFDCVYVQDETGGLCCFPISGNYKVGDKVRIVGHTDTYQGEPELQVKTIEVVGEGTVEPTVITAAQLNDRTAEGLLITIQGTVESYEIVNGLIQTIMVKDAEGNLARVFIDGYITTDKEVENVAEGKKITVTGLASYDDTFNAPEGPFPRIRIRNRADIICTEAVDPNAAVVAGKSLTLKGKIALNFYLELPEIVTEDENAYVTINDEKFLVSAANTIEQNGKTLYSFSTYVKMAQLTEERVLRLYNGENELVTLLDVAANDITETGCVYKAQDYIEYVRENMEDEALRAVVNTLSDVGSLSQLQFNYNPDTRVEVQGDLSAVTADSVSQYAMTLNAKTGVGITYYGSSLLLNEDSTIRHYFTVQSGSISQFTFKVDGKKVNPVKKGSYYYIAIPNVAAKDLDKNFHVEVSSKTSGVVISMDYCALSYVYKQLATGETGTLMDLLKALVLYNQAANAFFG